MGHLLVSAHTAHDKLEKLQRKIWRDKSQIKDETINGNTTIKAFGRQGDAVAQDINLVNIETVTHHNHRGIWGWFDTRRDAFRLVV